MGVLQETLLVASEIPKLERLRAKWDAGYRLTKEEFNEICEQRKNKLQEFKKHIDEVAKSISILGNMLKKSFADLVAAQNALQVAKAQLRSAKPGTSEETAAQAEVDRCKEAYKEARSRHLKIEAKKQEMEKDKEKLDKLYEQWKDALDSFIRHGEERLLELYRHGQKLDEQTLKAIQLTRSGLSHDA